MGYYKKLSALQLPLTWLASVPLLVGFTCIHTASAARKGGSGSKTHCRPYQGMRSVAWALLQSHLSSPQPWPTEVVIILLIIKILPSLISHTVLARS